MSGMNVWRKHKGKFEKVNGPFLDRLFDWWECTTPGEFTTERLRMIARVRKVMRKKGMKCVEE